MKALFAMCAVLISLFCAIIGVIVGACLPIPGLTQAEDFLTYAIAGDVLFGWLAGTRLADLETAIDAAREAWNAAPAATAELSPFPLDKDAPMDAYPRFPADALLLVDAHNGDERWSGQQWNEYAAACQNPVSGGEFTVRLLEIIHHGATIEPGDAGN